MWSPRWTARAARRPASSRWPISWTMRATQAANGLQRQGMQVTVVHVTDSLMNQQLDEAAQLTRAAMDAADTFRTII